MGPYYDTRQHHETGAEQFSGLTSQPPARDGEGITWYGVALLVLAGGVAVFGSPQDRTQPGPAQEVATLSADHSSRP